MEVDCIYLVLDRKKSFQKERYFNGQVCIMVTRLNERGLFFLLYGSA